MEEKIRPHTTNAEKKRKQNVKKTCRFVRAL